jgi:hypothetical protein
MLEKRSEKARFFPGPDTVFFAREWPVPIRFERNNNGIVVGLISHESENIFARRIK